MQQRKEHGIGGVALALAALTAACASAGGGSGDEGGVLFHNGTIYLDPTAEPVGTLLVGHDGRVKGSARAELERYEELGYRLVDLAGGTAVPGLQDAHGHLSGYGLLLVEVDLTGAESYREVIERIAARAATLPAGSWITGRGWDQTRWPENAFPDHLELSRAVPEHPVLVRRVDGHAALANRRALEIAGLADQVDPEQPVGGKVVLDEAGRPTGVLVDTAMGLVSRHVPELDEESLRAAYLAAQERLLALGLVCVHDMGLGPRDARVLERLDAEGLLRLRVIGYLYANGGLAPETAARYPRPEDLDPASRLRVLGAKLMLDGALGSRGAALLASYSDAVEEEGLLRMEAADFAARVREVAAAGLQPATHAIGDRANRIALDVYEELLADPELERLRPRVEHAQIVAPEDWERFDALGVVPSMQPTHATSDMRWAGERLGDERLAGAYAWRRLTADPGKLAFGSDFPVERAEPLEGLFAARTRSDREGRPPGGWQPDQRLEGAQALLGFTRGAAWAAREEGERGLLLPGFFCDMTVLSVDPVTCAPEDLLDARVLLTVIEGQVEHDARGTY